ncbi:MAG: hypothetical protein HKO53_04970 [Gemmatimonadetes bacterium]|nr:hypothetical protein [Gemmatimonadota bacterium]
MAVHEAYARVTPYELLQPDEGWLEQHFPSVADEARQRGTDPWNPAAFAMLGAVGAAVGDLSPEDVAPGGDHGLAVYFTYHIWNTGADLAFATTDAVRTAVSGVSSGTETVGQDSWAAFVGRAGYVQLPQHLVWLESDGEDGPESIDGLFWAASPRQVLQVALVAGIRPDRPGFVLVPVPPQPLLELDGWRGEPAREGGGDFQSDLPGAELEGLLGLKTPAEAIKLAVGLLGLRARANGTEAVVASGEGERGSPPRSNLAYRVL